VARSGLYAGWIVLDARLAVFLALLCAGVTLLLLALLVRRRVWHEYVTLFVASWSVLFLIGFLLLQTVLGYPVLVERDFFPLR
jgi:hypothetical protein